MAALFFFALFFLSRTKITTQEMVIVATMGSAGGSLGFIANFYAAKAMVGEPYSVPQMTAFSIVTSLVGLVMVIPLRELLVVREKLPWPGSRATAAVIKALVEHGDPRQPKYLVATLAVAMFYVVFNNEDGVGWFPAETAVPLFGLAAYGAAISWAPFAIGGSYLMGMRTCVGFLVGALLLLVMAPRLPAEFHGGPHRYVWPGIGFLTASGLTVIVLNWRVTADALRSLMSLRGPRQGEPVLTTRTFALVAGTAFLLCTLFLHFALGVSFILILLLIAIGGLVQNVIATRAQAQTAFNPARVMGILLEGVCALFGGRAADINIAGAGFVAGSGAQAGNLTGDMAYGRTFGVRPSRQFWTQAATLIPCAVVSAIVFSWIAANKDISLESADLAAPVAKVWATTSLVFDGRSPMPPGATTMLLIGALAGIVYAVVEYPASLRARVPCSIGIGLGLVLPVSLGVSFFVGGFLLWIVLGRWFRIGEVTLTTLAVGCIVAEGIGGVLKAGLKIAGAI
jgi:uncharacterized oligopeptide transporter (OPT) family protein